MYAHKLPNTRTFSVRTVRPHHQPATNQRQHVCVNCLGEPDPTVPHHPRYQQPFVALALERLFIATIRSHRSSVLASHRRRRVAAWRLIIASLCGTQAAGAIMPCTPVITKHNRMCRRIVPARARQLCVRDSQPANSRSCRHCKSFSVHMLRIVYYTLMQARTHKHDKHARP